jgi:hypothetical protein
LKGLSQLSEEFDFGDLRAQLSEFRHSGDFNERTTTDDSKARMRLLALEQRLQDHEREIASLQSRFRREIESLHERSRNVCDMCENWKVIALTSQKKLN